MLKFQYRLTTESTSLKSDYDFQWIDRCKLRQTGQPIDFSHDKHLINIPTRNETNEKELADSRFRLYFESAIEMKIQFHENFIISFSFLGFLFGYIQKLDNLHCFFLPHFRLVMKNPCPIWWWSDLIAKCSPHKMCFIVLDASFACSSASILWFWYRHLEK